MTLHFSRLRVALAAGLSVAAVGGMSFALPASGAAGNTVAQAAAASHPAGQPLPGRLFAPYFETWTRDSISAVARASGARYLTLAFLQTPRRGSCRLTWNGSRRQPVVPGGRYTADIARLRAMGGDVIPSFGGFSADQGGTEIADSCHSVQKIARAYESVVTVYHVTRLDMDVEARSLNNKAGIARRSAAIALLQRWAAHRHQHVQIILTLGVEPTGMPGNCLAIVRSAIAHGVQVTAVNLMAFDYYNKRNDSDMGTEAISALRNSHRQLARLYPRLSARQVWQLEGVTVLPGIDDFPRKTEVTYLSEVQDLMFFARAHQLPMVSLWAIQRDDGRCPGTIDSNSCSGITQRRWAFSHLMEHYRSGRR
ncbi:MAG TPA: chitinase [Streptosporangiaceae bacterium]|jgi:hypothetical protein